MPIEVLMPALSPTMEKGNLAKWLKKEGDTVKSGDVIAEIETDKATMEVEAADEGTLGKILVPEGTADVRSTRRSRSSSAKARTAPRSRPPSPPHPSRRRLRGLLRMRRTAARTLRRRERRPKGEAKAGVSKGEGVAPPPPAVHAATIPTSPKAPRWSQ